METIDYYNVRRKNECLHSSQSKCVKQLINPL